MVVPNKVVSVTDKNLLIKHLINLPNEDLRLRFGYVPSQQWLVSYIDRTWASDGDQWFIVWSGIDVIASAHVSIFKTEAEIGFTVSPEWRKQGIGDTLFKRAVVWAKSFGAEKLYIQCLSENIAVQKIAKNNGMSIHSLGGGEKSADLVLKPDNLALIKDVAYDRLAVYDAIYRTSTWLVGRCLNYRK